MFIYVNEVEIKEEEVIYGRKEIVFTSSPKILKFLIGSKLNYDIFRDTHIRKTYIIHKLGLIEILFIKSFYC